MDLLVIAIVFGVIFLGELPDKSMVATLVLSTRYRPLYVWLGAAAAFLVHVVIAVTAGRLLGLLPHRIVEIVVAGLFLLGAGLLLWAPAEEEEADVPKNKAVHGFPKVFAASFGVIFLGEWGDITQIATANYAAHYHDSWSVGLGAVLALWTVAGLAVTVGQRLLKRLPAGLLHKVTAGILLIFGIISLVQVFR